MYTKSTQKRITTLQVSSMRPSIIVTILPILFHYPLALGGRGQCKEFTDTLFQPQIFSQMFQQTQTKYKIFTLMKI